MQKELLELKKRVRQAMTNSREADENIQIALEEQAQVSVRPRRTGARSRETHAVARLCAAACVGGGTTPWLRRGQCAAQGNPVAGGQRPPAARQGEGGGTPKCHVFLGGWSVFPCVQNLEDIVHYQNVAKHFEALDGGKQRLRFKDVETYQEKIEQEKATLQALDGIVEYLARENGGAARALGSIQDTIRLQLERQHGSPRA
jgi:hypothetical protein